MNANPKNSLWFRLVGAFACVTLLTLAISLFAFYVISQSELTRFLEGTSSSIGQVVRQALPEDLSPRTTIITGPDSEGVVAVTVPLEKAILETTASESAQFLKNLRWAGVLVMAVATALAFLFGTLLFRQITRPLIELQAAARRLGSGELAARVVVTTQDEVGQMGLAFNQMADQLENLHRLRRQMIADIAHELRTPLSVIRSNLEAMLDGLIRPEPEELADVHEEVVRLTRLTEDLRLLSLADAGQLHLTKGQVDVGDLIETTIRQMMPLASQRKIILEGDIQGVSTTIAGDYDKLKQALVNLVDNGLRFTAEGGCVRVLARQVPDELRIEVKDDGPGIPLSDQPYVFERFWRGDHARSHSAGGSGLGLAIVKEIISLHGGTIRVDSPPGGTCAFTIILPI